MKTYVIDLSDPDEAALSRLFSEFSSLDFSTLIIDAGYGMFEVWFPRLFLNILILSFQSEAYPNNHSIHMFHTNLITHQRIIQALLPHICTRKGLVTKIGVPSSSPRDKLGCVILLSSVTGILVNPYDAMYSATKAALATIGYHLVFSPLGLLLPSLIVNYYLTSKSFFSLLQDVL